MRSLEKHFLNERENFIVKAVYGTTVYSLYNQFLSFGEFDEDLETFTLAQEMNEDLAALNKDQIAEIYLFFDYDKHASNASDKTLNAMLTWFDNETEKGKLYISYPMVEAIKHLSKDVSFQHVKAKCNSKYKERVSLECSEGFKHFNRYKLDTWHALIQQHAMKANFLVNNVHQYPSELIEQLDIFNSQLAFCQSNDEEVGVLSAFPLFLIDYYGVAKFNAS